jgi:glucokinase
MEANPDQIKVDLEQLLSLFCTTLGNVVGDLAHGRERESKQRGKE